MQGKMKVAVMTGPRKMEWTEREIPQPQTGELQIKLEYVGVCGSDLHFYSDGRLANWVPDGPLVLGHEPGGLVTAIGEGVEGFQIGDRVALEPGVPCGHCEDCLKGHYNLCKSVQFMAIPGEKDGVFSEYCTHAASMTFHLPENVSTMEGALIEPLAVGMHACELSGAQIGESAVILGAGCIGLCTLLALKSFVKKLPGGGVDQVYECAGNRITTLQSCRLIKRAGKVTLVGVSPEPVLELDIATLNAMEGTIYSVYRYRNLYPTAIQAVSSGLIPVSKIVSHIYDFTDVIEGVDYNLNHKDEVIKMVIRY